MIIYYACYAYLCKNDHGTKEPQDQKVDLRRRKQCFFLKKNYFRHGLFRLKDIFILQLSSF